MDDAPAAKVPTIGKPGGEKFQSLEDSGKPPSAIKAENPRTGQTELIGQDEGGFKLVAQDDGSAAARQAKAEADALASARAEMDARQGRMFEIDPAKDIGGASRQQGQAGAVQIPQSKIVRQLGRRIRQLLTPHRGVGEDVYGMWVKSEALKDAAMLAARNDYGRIEKILGEVKARVGRDRAQEVIRQFQDGVLTLPQVEQALEGMQLLTPLITAACEGSLDARLFHRLFRKRHSHGPYLDRLIDQLEKTGHRHLAARAARNAAMPVQSILFHQRLSDLAVDDRPLPPGGNTGTP
jgi:hypothetical protein